jgi:hypothetical protein
VQFIGLFQIPQEQLAIPFVKARGTDFDLPLAHEDASVCLIARETGTRGTMRRRTGRM